MLFIQMLLANITIGGIAIPAVEEAYTSGLHRGIIVGALGMLAIVVAALLVKEIYAAYKWRQHERRRSDRMN